MAQGAMAGPERARLEQAVADPTVDKPILKAVAKPTRPGRDRGPGAQVPRAAEHLFGGTPIGRTRYATSPTDRAAVPHTGPPRIKRADDLHRRASPAFGRTP